MEALDTAYEAFLPEHGDGVHRVVAVCNSARGAELRELVRIGDAVAANRLADALNSRRLGRRNHTARLAAALSGLPLTVQAAALRVPIGHPDDEPDLLAGWLSADPIDGLLLFPHSTTGPWARLTPCTAYCLAAAAEALGDACQYALITGCSPRSATRKLGRLIDGPHAPDFAVQVATACDEITAALRDGLLPDTTTVAAELALDLAVEHSQQMWVADSSWMATCQALLPSGGCGARPHTPHQAAATSAQ